MRLLAPIVRSLVARIKGDPSYRIAPELRDRQLATVLWHRGRQYWRGLSLRLRAWGVRGAVFRGRRVVVEHAYAFSSKRGLVLEDGVAINALSKQGIRLGRNVTIARGAILTCTGVIAELGDGITIGDRSAVGAGSFLGGQGGIRIGNDVIMGPAVRVFSENHVTSDLDRPIRAQGQTRDVVTIEDDCWIGAGATLVAGVTIGRGSVVGAGAVVTDDLPAYSVAAGVPARVIRSRRPEEPVPEALRAQAPELLRQWPQGVRVLQGDR
jgi:acetyltransferase-like isoleucine patch superfamily enzyme